MSETIRILGTMSGSSLDGLDLAVVEFKLHEDNSIDWDLLATGSEPFSKDWTQRLEKSPTLTGFALSTLDTDTGVMFGNLCKKFIERTGIEPDYIASHGHTAIHAPKHGFTLQIGKPSHIAATAGIPVIADFRSTDIAHGGQGAPLAPIAERYLFSGFGMYLNLGGIANLSTHSSEVRAWDICPCNQLLNFLAGTAGHRYDDRGQMAATGKVNQELLDQLDSVIQLPHTSPYSLDNSFILTEFIPLLKHADLPVEDKLRTSCEYISGAIATQCTAAVQSDGVENTLLVTGGSAHNDFLVQALRDRLANDSINVTLPDVEIIDFKEAILIALCGLLRLIEVPNALGSVTGASRDTVNGGVYLPA